MRISTRALLLTAAAATAFLVGVIVRGNSDGGDPTHGPILPLDVPPVPPVERVPPLGQSGWFPVLWAIDRTVGLPPSDGLGMYPDHVSLARKFVMRLEDGAFDGAARLVSIPLRERFSADTLADTWRETVRRLGAPDALDGERRWSTVEIPSSGTPHTSPEAACTVSFLRDHARGCTTIRVQVVRGKYGPEVRDLVVERYGFRRGR